MAKLCPLCHRFTVNYDPRDRIEKCFALNCTWTQNTEVSKDEKANGIAKKHYKMSDKLSTEPYPAPSL